MDPPIRLPAEFVEKLFREFVTKYNRTYASGQNPEEYQKRLNIFTVIFYSSKSDSFIYLEPNSNKK